MMKATGIILLLMAGGIYIYRLYSSCNKRIMLIKKLISDNEIMKNEIYFKLTPLAEVFSVLCDGGICDEFYRGIIDSLSLGDPPEAAFEKSVGVFSGIIRKEDAGLFRQFSKLLGTTDTEGQKRAFDAYGDLLYTTLAEAQAERNEKLKPKCAMLSFVFISVAILFI